MASKRIRYSKMDETKQVSVKRFNHETNGARYKVVLDLAEKQWLVIDDGSDVVAASGHQVSLHRMKLEAKAALTALGITFTEECRKSKNSPQEQAA